MRETVFERGIGDPHLIVFIIYCLFQTEEILHTILE